MFLEAADLPVKAQKKEPKLLEQHTRSCSFIVGNILIIFPPHWAVTLPRGQGTQPQIGQALG